MAAQECPSGSLMFSHNIPGGSGTCRPVSHVKYFRHVVKFPVSPTRHSVAPFLFLQCRDARRNSHGLNAAGLPDGYRGSPGAVLAQVDADYRLTGGRSNRPARLARLKILDRQQYLGFVGGWNVQSV